MDSNNFKTKVLVKSGNKAENIATKYIEWDGVKKINASCRGIQDLLWLKSSTTLQELNINYNKLASLDGFQKYTALQILNIGINNITSLDGLQNCTALVSLNANSNRLTSLDGLQKCTALQSLSISFNNITSLDVLHNCPDLQSLESCENSLVSLDGLYNCTNLNYLEISYNPGLTTLPNFLLEFTNIQTINYNGLELELDTRQLRWLNRKKKRYRIMNTVQVYDNTQNVHDSSIQESVRSSMRRLLNQPHIPKLSDTSLDTLRNQIVLDTILTPKSKDQLLTYISSDEELLELFLTYGELLWAVWHTIHTPVLALDTGTTGFNQDTQREIKQILNQELADSDCKCFTGRMTRLVNVLNGFSPLVEVKILDSAQIGNIVSIIKQKLEESKEGYSVEKHRKMFREEMLDRGESVTVIEEWLEYIE